MTCCFLCVCVCVWQQYYKTAQLVRVNKTRLDGRPLCVLFRARRQPREPFSVRPERAAAERQKARTTLFHSHLATTTTSCTFLCACSGGGVQQLLHLQWISSV